MFWVVERILLSCCFLAEKMNKQQQQQKTTNKKKKTLPSIYDILVPKYDMGSYFSESA